MTLLDLLKLMRKNWLLIVAIPVVCALVCFGVLGLVPATYSARATLVASGELTILNGNASGIANRKAAETDLDVQATMNATNQTVTITVRGDDADECVKVANETAAAAREATLKFLGQDPEAIAAIQDARAAATESSVDPGNPTEENALLYARALLDADDVTISLTEATKATDVSPAAVQYVIVAFLAGLLAAIAIVLIKDMARGSIHNAYEVEENYDLRSLGGVRASARRRSDAAAEEAALLAALDFAGADKRAICLVPMEHVATAKRVVAALETVAETAGKRLACVGENANLTLADPDALATAIASQAPAGADLLFVMAPAVADSADFAYLAPACGCAVLVIEAMRTKRVHLESALRQLALSETTVAGFVMVNDA